MGRIISDRIDYGAAEHVKSVVSVLSVCNTPRASAMWSLISSGSVLAFDFSMQSAITVVGFGSATYLSIGVGSYNTHTSATLSKWYRPPADRSGEHLCRSG
jgi:hypothetical protein